MGKAELRNAILEGLSHRELCHRFAVKPGYLVPGATSKLWKAFLRDNPPKSVVTYFDRIWPELEISIYERLGFEKDGTVPPTYTYTKSYHHRVHKSNFSKAKLAEKFEGFNPDLTEIGNMRNFGYDRIWDCGRVRYLWKKGLRKNFKIWKRGPSSEGGTPFR
jgi:hypothetical protein